MSEILLVAFGGALGSVFRYLVTNLATALWGKTFPLGTLIANILGSFVMGLLMALIIAKVIDDEKIRLAFCVGLLGGFTTFSSFAFETVNLINAEQLGIATYNIILNILLCLGAVYLGIYTAKII